MNDLSDNLAKAIQLQRKKSGLTQKQLAEFAGVGKTAIFDIEHGKKTVRLDTLLKVLKILNIENKINHVLQDILNEES